MFPFKFYRNTPHPQPHNTGYTNSFSCSGGKEKKGAAHSSEIHTEKENPFGCNKHKQQPKRKRVRERVDKIKANKRNFHWNPNYFYGLLGGRTNLSWALPSEFMDTDFIVRKM